MLTARDVAQHNSRQSCWVIIEAHAYDLTDFVDDHPGGSSVIMRYAGKVFCEFFGNISNMAHPLQ